MVNTLEVISQNAYIPLTVWKNDMRSNSNNGRIRSSVLSSMHQLQCTLRHIASTCSLKFWFRSEEFVRQVLGEVIRSVFVH